MTSTNGNGAHRASTPREQLLADVRAQAGALTERREYLRAELAELDADLRAYAKAIVALDPESPAAGDGSPAPRRGRSRRRAGVGPERLAEIEAAFRAVADRNGGEARQVDVCDATGYSSSIMTSAFDQLREGNVIRLARVAKNPGGRGRSKYYRLTRPAARRGHHATVDHPRPPKEATREAVLDAVRRLGRPATFAAIGELSGVGDVALRNAVHALEAEGALVDAGLAEVRSDGRRGGKRPRTWLPADAGGAS